MSKNKKKYNKRSNKAKDNLGLAYKYAKSLADKFDYIGKLEDSEFFSNALLGLVAAEKNYDPTKINPITNKPYKFSTYAYRCMMSHCTRQHTIKQKEEPLDNVIPITKEQIKDGMLDKIFVEIKEGKEQYESKLILSNLRSKIRAMIRRNKSISEAKKKSIRLDFEMLLKYYLEEKTLEEVGEEFEVSKERVRQRIDRSREFIFSKFAYEDLENAVELKIKKYRNKKIKSCNSKKFAMPIGI